MKMNSIPSSTAEANALTPERAKALQAGMQFEAVLLNTALGPLEHSFAHLPGEKKKIRPVRIMGGWRCRR